MILPQITRNIRIYTIVIKCILNINNLKNPKNLISTNLSPTNPSKKKNEINKLCTILNFTKPTLVNILYWERLLNHDDKFQIIKTDTR